MKAVLAIVRRVKCWRQAGCCSSWPKDTIQQFKRYNESAQIGAVTLCGATRSSIRSSVRPGRHLSVSPYPTRNHDIVPTAQSNRFFSKMFLLFFTRMCPAHSTASTERHVGRQIALMFRRAVYGVLTAKGQHAAWQCTVESRGLSCDKYADLADGLTEGNTTQTMAHFRRNQVIMCLSVHLQHAVACCRTRVDFGLLHCCCSAMHNASNQDVRCPMYCLVSIGHTYLRSLLA
jgi:hypothetical protein